jgi:hypothetical protein
MIFNRVGPVSLCLSLSLSDCLSLPVSLSLSLSLDSVTLSVSQQGSELYALGDYFADFFESELKLRRKERHLRATDPEAIPSKEEKKNLDQLLLQTGPCPCLLLLSSSLSLTAADSDCLGVIINYLSKHSPDSLETVHVTHLLFSLSLSVYLCLSLSLSLTASHLTSLYLSLDLSR